MDTDRINVDHLVGLDGSDEGAATIAIGPTGDIVTIETRPPDGAASGRGLTAIPLLADAHAHLAISDGVREAAAFYTLDRVDAQLRHLALRGVGHVHSLGTDQRWLHHRLARRVASADAGEKAFGYTAGIGFGALDGWPPELTAPEERFRPSEPDQARRQVRDLAKIGCRTLKIWVDDIGRTVPKIPRAIVEAIIDEAKRVGIKTFAHVFYHEDADALISFGISALAHSVRDGIMQETLIERMAERGVVLVPTLAREEAEMAFSLEHNPYFEDAFFLASERAVAPRLQGKMFSSDFETPRRRLEIALENVGRAHAGGVAIGLGTDSGFKLKPQGFLQHRELQLLGQAGLLPSDCLKAGLQVNKDLFASAMTAIAPGEPASFFLVDGNPFDDIRATQDVREVWVCGKRLTGPDACWREDLQGSIRDDGGVAGAGRIAG